MDSELKHEQDGKALKLMPFLLMALTISAPSMLQSLINTMVGTADTVMLGYVSQDAMSASSLANELQLVMSMAFYGLMAGASCFPHNTGVKRTRAPLKRYSVLPCG